MPLPIVALAAKLLPFAAMIPDVIRAFGGEREAEVAEKLVKVATAVSGETDPEAAVSAIINKPELQLEFQKLLSQERLEFKRMEYAAEAAAETNVTERWQADMSSDDKLSKRVRPVTLLWMNGLFTFMIIAGANGVAFADNLVELALYLLITVYGAYFLGRTGEKAFDIVRKWKAK
jgi:hypothetical protein